jgi:transcription elongation factor GreA
MVLTIHYDDDPADSETLLLGSREEGAHGDVQVISPNSPLGAALLGARVGETREYRLPDGGSMKVTLVSAEPFTG